MDLTSQQKTVCGYDWVMARLEPASPLGRALARTPRWYGPGEESALEEEWDRVEVLMAADRTAVEHTLHQLSQFRDIRNSLHRTHSAPMDEVELFELKHFLLNLEALSALAPALKGLTITPMTALLDRLDPSGRRLAPFSVESAFDPALGRIREEKARIEAALREGQTEELLAQRQEMVRQEDAAELAARRRLTSAVLEEKAALLAALDAVARLDLTLAKARLAAKYGCVRPGLACAIAAADMTHPQVAAHVEERGGTFAPVSMELERGSTVITGANMGGKSVSLKAITLNLLLLHTGFFVFAKALSAPLMHGVYLIGGDEESVERGLSSFGAEMKELDEVLRKEEGHPFFLALDEFARGTNPREGAALARALVKYLDALPCVALLSTHYDGVAPAARRHYQVAGLDEGARKMDYRLIPAAPDAPCPRDAMKVCRLLGLEEKLLRHLEENI